MSRTFPVLWGIWLFHKVRSDLHKARQMCDELFALSEKDPALRLQAHQALCITHLCLGDPRVAADHMELAEAIYDPEQHAGNTQLFGQDPGVATLAFGAVALYLLGRTDQAHDASDRSLALARRLRQPSSLALALHFAGMLHQLCDDPAGVERCATEVLAIASEEGFSFWRAGGLVLRGWARAAAARPDTEAGLDDIRHGLDAWLAAGSRTYHAYFLGLLGDALLRLRRPSDAVAPLLEGIGVARDLNEGFYAAELHRLYGRALLRTGSREARDKLCEAAATARAQGARRFERVANEELAGVSKADAKPRASGQSVQRRKRELDLLVM